jgi:hypothetical protein
MDYTLPVELLGLLLLAAGEVAGGLLVAGVLFFCAVEAGFELLFFTAAGLSVLFNAGAVDFAAVVPFCALLCAAGFAFAACGAAAGFFSAAF